MASIGDPLVAPSGEAFSFCQDRFDLVRGRFLGRERAGTSFKHDFDVERTGLPGADLVAMAKSASGNRAVVIHADGRRAIVELPAGDLVAELPPVPKPARRSPAAALDANGELVAYVDALGVHVAKLGPKGLVALRVEREPLSQPIDDLEIGDHRLVFAPDARTLFVWAGYGEVQIFRRDQAFRHRPAATISFAAPPGFRSATFRGSELTFSKFEDTSERRDQRLVARLRSLDDTVDVAVYALDPDEFAEPELDAWARAVLRRFEWGSDDPASWPAARLGRDERGRSFEYASFVREGCEPKDHYVRMIERGGVLYRIVLTFPPQTELVRVRSQLKAFFDDPFGESDPRRSLATLKSPPPSPC